MSSVKTVYESAIVVMRAGRGVLVRYLMTITPFALLYTAIFFLEYSEVGVHAEKKALELKSHLFGL
jgi:hypothetical protein